MNEPIIDETAVKEISEMLMQIQELLKQGLVPIEVQVDCAINEHITNEKQLEDLFDSLLDYTQIEEGLVVFKRLCRYCFPLYPNMTASYVYAYRDLYDPEYILDCDE